MIDKAISNALTEKTFDESMLSSIEVKMAKFLASCEVSSKNINDEKNKIKELISDISHQTKTPIANIILYTQLLSETNLPSDCDQKVQILSDQAKKLNFLVESLLKSSRLETGIISIEPKLGKIQDVINTAIMQARAKANTKNISITVSPTEQTALFDAKWTAEAIYNILDNAIKYSSKDSSITIKTTPYELFCRIDIIDKGRGINEDEYSKIFRRFYRSPAVADKEGVGIGLYLSRDIISRNGGYIKVNSKEMQGSVFSIFLPLDKL